MLKIFLPTKRGGARPVRPPPLDPRMIMSLENKLFGRKIKFNCLVQPNLIQPFFKCTDMILSNFRHFCYSGPNPTHKNWKKSRPNPTHRSTQCMDNCGSDKSCSGAANLGRRRACTRDGMTAPPARVCNHTVEL